MRTGLIRIVMLLQVIWISPLCRAAEADSFRFPLDVSWTLTQGFRNWNSDWYGYHLGEDVKTDSELPVLAAGNGKVIHVKQHQGYGWVVIIEHSLPTGDPLGPTVITLYAHLRHADIIGSNSIVSKGDRIGFLSSDPNENGGYPFTHLHFAVRQVPAATGCTIQDDPTSNWWIFAGYSSLFETCNDKKSEIRVLPSSDQWPLYSPLHDTIVARWLEPSKFIQARLTAQSNNFLFIANESSSTIAAFAISNETGNLATVPGSPFATGHLPVSVATTPNGRFLFVGTEDQPGPLVSYSINQDGSLQMNGAFPVGELTFPLFISTEPSSHYIFLTWQSSGPSFMLGSSFDPISGILPLNYFDGGRGGNSITADPLGRFIFSAGTDAFVTGEFLFTRPFNSTTGTFSGPQKQQPADAFPSSLIVDSNGKFLYVANRGLNAVSAYVINPADGSLTPVAGSPFTSGPNGRCLVTDKSGKFLYISTEPHDVWSYTINQLDGTLAFLNHFSFIGDPAGAGCLTIDPSGSFLYSTNPQSGSVSGFKVDPATGDLAPLPGFPVSTGGLAPLAIASSQRP